MTTPLPRVRTRLEMPFLLLCGMGFLAFFVAVGTVAYIVVLFGALVGSSGFAVNGVSTNRAGFFAAGWPVFVMYPPALAGFGVIVYGLWRERQWTRLAMMWCWAAVILISVGAQVIAPDDVTMFATGLIITLVCWAVAWWYCFRKRSVVAYYAAITARATAASGGTPLLNGV